jgi:hypothetical protein
MIRSKLEIGALMKSLNELEKLKLLLFDTNQYYLFEHIPKPFLFDSKMMALQEENPLPKIKATDTNVSTQSLKKRSSTADRVLCNQTFWRKDLVD